MILMTLASNSPSAALPRATTGSPDDALRAIGLFGIMTAILVTTAVVVGVLVYLRWRRRQASITGRTPPPPLDPWTEAARRFPSERDEGRDRAEPEP